MKITSPKTFNSFLRRWRKIKFKKTRRIKPHAPKSLTTKIEVEPSHSASAGVVLSNQDILNLIFSKIEKKHLPALKTVCKIWYQSITGRKFAYKLPPPSELLIRRYTPRTRPLHRSMVKHITVPLNVAASRRQPDTRQPLVEANNIDVNGILIHQSCNGLLLCPAGNSSGKHYVYNPTTNESRLIPLPEDDDENMSTEVTVMNLAFDPSESHHYKIVSLSRVTRAYFSYTRIDIYSSETRRWRVSKAELPRHCDHVDFSKGVFLNGAIHWPSLEGDTSVYLDVEKECFETMAMPAVQGGQSRRTIRYFGEAGGRLLLIDFHEPYTRNFDLFQLEDYSTWTVRCHIDLSRPILLERFRRLVLLSGRFYVLSVFCGSGSDKDDLSLVIYNPGRDKEGKGLMTFNLREAKLKKVHSPVPGCWDLRLFEEQGFLVVHPHIRTRFKV